MHPFRKLIHISMGRAERFDTAPTHKEWLIMFSMAKTQTLLGVLFDGIERLPEEQRPPESIYNNWKRMAERITQIHQTHEQRVHVLAGILQHLGLHGTLLKGTGLARLYPIPEHRMCGDIDVWIEGTHESILTAFDQAGYGIGDILYQECKVGVFDDIIVEVHFHPTKMYNPFHNARLQRCLEAMSPIRKDAALTLPDARFNAVYCMAHMFRHYLEGGIGLRQMMDYYYILRILDPADRQPVMVQLKSLGMAQFTAAVMLSMQFNFGLEDEYLLCPPDRKLGRKLVKDMISMGNFGIMDRRNHSTKQKEGKLARFIRKNKRVFANFKYYPGEIIWSPYARIHQYFWRLVKGYL